MSPRSSARPSSPERASEGAPFAKAKRRLLKVLRARGIARVHIDYDGEGDGGQIETIFAADAKEQRVDLNLPTKLMWADSDPPIRHHSLEEALDAFAWMLLRHFHDGFEINDGGFGTITIDVAAATIRLNHNDRVVDCCNTTTEV